MNISNYLGQVVELSVSLPVTNDSVSSSTGKFSIGIGTVYLIKEFKIKFHSKICDYYSPCSYHSKL